MTRENNVTHYQPNYLYPPMNQPQPVRPEVAHLLTWPALALAVTALMVSLAAPPIAYTTTLALAGTAFAAALPGMIASVQRRHPLAIVGAASLTLATIALTFGFLAMGEMRDAFINLQNTLGGLSGLVG